MTGGSDTRLPIGSTPGDDFAFLEVSISELQAAMSEGRLNARSLAAAYIDRIRALDERGPTIRSVVEINPDALSDAASLDRERRSQGSRGPLHGVPILIKDNIATGDLMQTTAGSLALVGCRARRDAEVVSQLRKAGVVLLGKTNLSEWANIRSLRSTSGWSGRGGLTCNPYALDRNPSGSSSGSAAAVTANFAAAAIGTETDGSIVSPASINGLVGIKPTVGLISSDGIIPISTTQDTAGPMARSVADAAVLLGAMVHSEHPSRPMGTAGPADYTSFLGSNRLEGARLGVVRSAFGTHPGVLDVMEHALRLLTHLGAVLIDPVELGNLDDLGELELEVLLHEFNVALPQWLAEFAPDGEVSSLDDIIAWNAQHHRRELQWFGQELFERAASRGPLSDTTYQRALAKSQRLARSQGIDAALTRDTLDGLVAPTGGPAWLTDLVNGDHETGSFSSPAAVAGYPHITVPAGNFAGLPIGLSFVGPAWSESQLIGFASAYEHSSRSRRPPTFAPTIPL